MVDQGVGDYFISDADVQPLEDDDLLKPPIVIPRQPAAAAPASPAPAAVVEAPQPAPEPAAAPAPPAPAAVQQPSAAVRPVAAVGRPASREERLAAVLDGLIQGDPDIQAAALVSLDGFTMAAALPAGMQSDRVGAMSAAILGLGERAATELGRGHLSQVFIEGEDGYVLLVAAGSRAVLTVMASAQAKLGLVLYDMKTAAAQVAEILG
ncbi:roadblock/LC7 domain-containing protein [Parvivirga hydrogeniphila]|uniref:roadblock/LC7 domain-containing protein n=1 Tax=Parvivirga hydrogeniphila TaxID=2939460 RepID=UPI002B2722B1|nr:roadblock/LC7 domain-containing protein [Parvivirga hydrogeniphila]